MTDPYAILGLAGLIALILALLGCWTLHYRLRTRASLVLVLSLSALVLWTLLSSVVLFFVFTYMDKNGTLGNWIALSSEIILPAVLLLCAAVSFWVTTRSVDVRADLD